MPRKTSDIADVSELFDPYLCTQLRDPAELIAVSPDCGVLRDGAGPDCEAPMLSHESRYFVVVAASAVAGAAVAWVPLTSAPLPFRETSSWVHLFDGYQYFLITG